MPEQNTEKPIVFLSHASLDKESLTALKKILDERAAGSLDFFLSSDGESIKFGRNWVVSVSDALARAKLMFVFLSRRSADSKWIHFEAGCAYASGVRVVPVCLPGIDLNKITPPLSLLQGFNLHTHEAIGNIARICNEKFAMKINEVFRVEDFDSIMGNAGGVGHAFFGEFTDAIHFVSVSFEKALLSPDYNPIPSLHDLCQKAGMNCYYSTTNPPKEDTTRPERPGASRLISKFEQPGFIGTFSIIAGTQKQYRVSFTLSPELYHINAPLLTEWLEAMQINSPIEVNIQFQRGTKREPERNRFTTKLHICGIKIGGMDEKDSLSFQRVF